MEGNKLDFARSLRRNQTDAETKLWYYLRNRLLKDFKFRRQHPIGKYIVDFVCLEQRLVIELDGGQHQERKAEDQIRTEFLKSKGYRVIRFWNHDIFNS